MQITPEYVMGLKEKAEEQRQRLIAEVHKATGAIAALDMILKRMEEKEEPTC